MMHNNFSRIIINLESGQTPQTQMGHVINLAYAHASAL